jgi:type VI secretion system secreted protein VgrG
MAMNITAPSSANSEGGGAAGSSITMDGKSITLKVGKSLIVMQEDGTIVVNGNTIDVVGSKHIGMESDRIDLN